MSAYIASALLVKAYCLEETSPEAVALIRQAVPPLPFTDLHSLEIRNALRLKRHRGELTEGELTGALQNLQRDLDSGLLERPIYDLPAVFQKAESLSTDHTVATGARSLDVVHVAAALAVGASEFFSFDRRQRSLAERVGLKLLPIRIAVVDS